MHKLLSFLLISCFSLALPATLQAQGLVPTSDGPAAPAGYTIAGITTSGAQYLDQDLLLAVSGLAVGQKVQLPYDEGISKAIRNLWKQDLFADVRVDITNIVGDKIFLNIVVEERPRLSRYNFRGISKGEATDLRSRTGLVSNRVVTDAVKTEAIVRIRNFYVDKGFGNVSIRTIQRPDTTRPNTVVLTFIINKGNKTRINQINIAGNDAVSDARLKRAMKGTKEMTRLTLHRTDDASLYPGGNTSSQGYWSSFGFLSVSKTLDALDPYFRFRVFSSSKFNETKYEDDKQNLLAVYNSLGYRDAVIEADTVHPVTNGNLNIDLRVREGKRYYFGDIQWRGNTKYSSDVLATRLGIKRGDVYNQDLLDQRIGRTLAPEGDDIGSLYMDDGYLFFNIDPVETSIVGDTINYEMRVTEGGQATIGRVNISGNDRTNEHVVRRELRTIPGAKFSRADIIRSQREIGNLGFFDPNKIGITPRPHPETGTVDIDYALEEKSSDQLQLSAGFGGGVNFYGNIGVVFNNFSARNIFKPKQWDPLPIGDGQKFSLSFQSNGIYYRSFTTSFTEPWLGGKKPTALTLSYNGSRFSQGINPSQQYLKVNGGGVSISKRLKWPDDNFILTAGINYQRYYLKNYAFIASLPSFDNGHSNNLYARLVLARYSVDNPLYPTSGSNISLSLQFTPPFSRFSDRDYAKETVNEKFRWIEYHKYRFTADWYQRVAGKLVLKFSTKMGFLGYYNPSIGFSPFERFQLGGDGLQGQSFFVGRDVISQRGYEIYAEDATIFNKYTAELRYPFSTSASATIYGLVFADAANAWNRFQDYKPFKLNRDAGLGIRLFLPMFGLMGLDYGVGFDRYDPSRGQTRFKDISRLTFMLGFEPD